MKNSAHILGLDLGTNSVGWALLNANQFRIAGNGSRIIPMTGDVMTDFAKGKLQSAASQRTAFRNVRKNIERVKQRRYRLLQVLHILGFYPSILVNKLTLSIIADISLMKLNRCCLIVAMQADGTLLFSRNHSAKCWPILQYISHNSWQTVARCPTTGPCSICAKKP